MRLWSCLENFNSKIQKDQTVSHVLNYILEQSSRNFIRIQKYLVSNKAKFAILGIWWEITKYAKKPGNMRRKWSLETNQNWHRCGKADKYIEIVIIIESYMFTMLNRDMKIILKI